MRVDEAMMNVRTATAVLRICDHYGIYWPEATVSELVAAFNAAPMDLSQIDGCGKKTIADLHRILPGLAGATAKPIAKCVGRDGNVEPEIAAKLFGAEPSVGNEPMKETRFTDYKPE